MVLQNSKEIYIGKLKIKVNMVECFCEHKCPYTSLLSNKMGQTAGLKDRKTEGERVKSNNLMPLCCAVGP